MRQRIGMAIVIAMVAASALFAAGAQDSGDAQAGTGRPELRIFVPFDTRYIGEEYVDNLSRACEMLDYDCEVEQDAEGYRTQILVELTAGQLPDVFFTWGDSYTEPFLEAGVLLPITEALRASGNQYYPSYVIPWTDGEIYTAPYTPNDHFVVYYNREIFAQAGVEPPETFDEFMDVIRTIQAEVPDVFPIGLGGQNRVQGDLWYNMMVLREDPEAFARAISGEGSFTDEPFLAAAERLREVIDTDPFQLGYISASQPEIQQMLWDGRVAMFPMGSWVFPNAIRNLGDNLGYFPFPQLTPDPDYRSKSTTLFGDQPNGMVVSRTTQFPEAATEFALLYSRLMNEEMARQGRITFMETTVTPEQPLHPAYAAYVADASQLTYLQPFWYGVIDPSIGEEMRDLNQEFFLGSMTPEEFTERLQTIMQRAIQD